MIHSPKQQGDILLKLHVVSICLNCFKYFRGILQVFYIDVTKLDQDVVHIAIVFSSVSQKFHLFQMYVTSVSSDVAKVYLDIAYTCMLQAYISSVSGVLYVCCK
jgi:hypothetical protein